jgi:putative RNA 2'-phosphotransferase
LFHGTTSEKWAKIQASGGLRPMGRHHVHLSPDAETASHVSARRKGVTVILEVDAQAMAADGHRFLVSDNRVWLAEAVPLSYLCVASIFPSRA